MGRRKRTDPYLKGLLNTRAAAAGRVEQLQSKLAEALKDLEACDAVIARDSPTVEPGDLKVLKAPRALPGGRGALSAAILEILKAKAPHPVSTRQMALTLQAGFGFELGCTSEAMEWMDNSVRSALKRLTR
jgi:hypothetical protein